MVVGGLREIRKRDVGVSRFAMQVKKGTMYLAVYNVGISIVSLGSGVRLK